jgi:Fur family ferric uptake transcriptional regulator
MIAATQSNHPLAPSAPSSDRSDQIEQVCAQLRAAGMRVTKPRMAIFDTLLKRQTPISIEQLHQELDRESCDLVTVYRCLSAFERIGLVRRSFSHSGTSLWEAGLNRKRHYHIMCKSCGRSEKVDDFSVGGMERMLTERGYADVSHVVEFFGVCPECQKTFGGRLKGMPAAATRG